MSYEHFVRLTSQLPFCSTPIRLDPYNHCQFSCGYCFARSRLGHGRAGRLQRASVDAFEARLTRVEGGEIKSALDEFLEQRIPIQLGGMSDPFMPVEPDALVTAGLMKVLRRYQYPYLISTKGNQISEDSYIEMLSESRVIVRFSITGISTKWRGAVDRGTPERIEVLRAIEKLTERGVVTSLRMQPILPGHEDAAREVISDAASAGARHVSLEYLKVPLEADRSFSDAMTMVLGNRPIGAFRALGAVRRGREYVLPLEYRLPHLLSLRMLARQRGMTVGLADNDLLHLSDGNSCCNGIATHLADVQVFRSNISSVLATSQPGDILGIERLAIEWMPKRDISPYLNSNARLPRSPDGQRGWPEYLQAIWRGDYGVHGPSGYFGIVATGAFDDVGNPLYLREATPFDAQFRT